MTAADLLAFCGGAVWAHRLRSALSALGIAIGIAAVTLLTGIGEGTRRYVLKEFMQFGTNILAINPGKTETTGLPGVVGGTTHPLTIEDALALERVPGVADVMPFAVGQARVEAGNLGRSVYVYGVTASMPALWRFEVRLGSFVPPGDPRRGAAVAVLGPTLARELFKDQSALGEFVRVGGTRLRVIGVLSSKGRVLGLDMDDAVYVPVATAMRLFNQDELQEIDVTFVHEGMVDAVVGGIERRLAERHRGEVDFTITTQTSMLEVLGKVMRVITAAMGAIGGISLLVGAIGILTTMWIAVGERTQEIGLLRSLGATGRQVLLLFLGESVILSLLGGLAGLAIGAGLALVLRLVLPGLPLTIAPGFVLAAVGVSVATGLLAGVLPARRASRLDPIEALRTE
ncbi:MAG: ABC transporter permease [Planctomycetota bacterium]